MTPAEATQLTAKLFAAYDKPREKLTAAVYIEALMKRDHAISLRAVDELIASEKWLPSVALFNEVCSRLTEAAIQAREARALHEPPVSEAQREENIRRIRALVEGIGGAA